MQSDLDILHQAIKVIEKYIHVSDTLGLAFTNPQPKPKPKATGWIRGKRHRKVSKGEMRRSAEPKPGTINAKVLDFVRGRGTDVPVAEIKSNLGLSDGQTSVAINHLKHSRLLTRVERGVYRAIEAA